MTTKTARFWHYHNSGPVLIKVRAGESLHHSYGGPTDEGWNREAHAWSFDGEVVTREWHSDGVDCDGRLSWHALDTCHVDDLKTGYVDPEDAVVSYPNWQHGKSGQRDYSAEAAGF